MREIKFRAWDKDSKKMFKIARFDFSDYTIYSHLFACAGYLGESCEIMQYTGLKDKNGVEIFVGDIVRHSEVATDISIVRFGEFGVPNVEDQSYQDCAIGFYYENASEFKDIEPFNMTVPLNSDYVKDVLVIGNIYENPELLSSGIE